MELLFKLPSISKTFIALVKRQTAKQFNKTFITHNIVHKIDGHEEMLLDIFIEFSSVLFARLESWSLGISKLSDIILVLFVSWDSFFKIEYDDA